MRGVVLIRFFLLLLSVGSTLMAQAPIEVATSERLEDSVTGLATDVTIMGRAEADVGAVLGNVTVDGGTVKGDISVMGGNVTLENATVEGTIVCLGGEVIRDASSTVGGRVIDFGRQKESLIRGSASKTSFFFAVCLICYLVAIFTFYFFPNQVSEASFELSQEQVRPAIVGIITLAAFLFLLAISFLLMVIGVGVMMFLVFFCGLMVIAIYGAVIVLFRLGQWIENKSGRKLSQTTGVLIAILILNLLLIVPLLGNLITALLLVFGTGIVMTTRFGTNKQWFTRKARYWGA